MKAIGYSKCLPLTDPKSLEDINLPQPVATGRDLLVKISAVAVNPVDYKVRQNLSPEGSEYKVIGWDAVGEVVATGDAVTGFAPAIRSITPETSPVPAVTPSISWWMSASSGTNQRA